MIRLLRSYAAALATARRRYDRETRLAPIAVTDEVRLSPRAHARWSRVVGQTREASIGDGHPRGDAANGDVAKADLLQGIGRPAQPPLTRT